MIRTRVNIVKHDATNIVEYDGDGVVLDVTLEGKGSIVRRISDVEFHAPNFNAGFSGISEIVFSVEKEVDGETVIVEEREKLRWGSAIHVVADIIQQYTELANNQITLGWTKNPVNNKNDVHVVLTPRPDQILPNRNEENGHAFVSCRDTIEVDVFSNRFDSTLMLVKISTAFKTDYAKTQYAINAIQVGALLNFTDVSAAEGHEGLKRYNASLNINYAVKLDVDNNNFESFDGTNLIINE